MSAIFNIGSLILGLISWLIPLIVLCQENKRHRKPAFSIISFTSCTLALVLQIFEIQHRVYLQDFTAIMDTINTLSLIVIILIVVTVILNILALKKFNTK